MYVFSDWELRKASEVCILLAGCFAHGHTLPSGGEKVNCLELRNTCSLIIALEQQLSCPILYHCSTVWQMAFRREVGRGLTNISHNNSVMMTQVYLIQRGIFIYCIFQ